MILASFAFKELGVGGRGRVEILPVPDGGSLRRRARVGRVLVSSGMERPTSGSRRGRRRGVGENVGKPPPRLAAERRRGRRDTWCVVAGGRAEKNSGSVLGDGEWFAGAEGGEGRAGETKGAAVVGVSSGEMVTSADGVLHKTAPLFAATDSVLTVELGGRASHRQANTLSLSFWFFSFSKTFFFVFSFSTTERRRNQKETNQFVDRGHPYLIIGTGKLALHLHLHLHFVLVWYQNKRIDENTTKNKHKKKTHWEAQPGPHISKVVPMGLN